MGLAPQRLLPAAGVTIDVPPFADGAVAELHHGPGGTVTAEIRIPGPGDCQQPCDTDCEIAPVHCWNHHRPNHKADWHDPVACDGR
jgi:hypothetical protein